MKKEHSKLEPKTTFWVKEASWYKEHLEDSDTYHAKVLLPNVLRLVGGERGLRVLEIGCGEGFFAREIAHTGATVVASDIASELIQLAKEKGGVVSYHVAPAQDISFVNPLSQDVVLAVLTLQNMEKLDVVMNEVARVLTKKGRFIFVLNHPIVRVPQASSWCYDEEKKMQYRRLDAYLSVKKVEVDMHPGKKGKKSVTYSFHRSLQEYMKLLRSAGFAVVRLEEWISHKTSEPGPRAKAENVARKEFPLFMAVEAVQIKA